MDSYGKSLLSANGDLDNYLYNFLPALVKFTTGETLKDRNQQQIFEGQLFRYFTIQEKRFFPLLQNSPAQKEHVGRILAETLQGCIVKYGFMQPNSKPDIPTLCFLVKIAVNASFYFENLYLIEECIKYITTILQLNKELQKEQKGLLYLHLIFAYSALKRNISSEEMEAILLAWCFFKSLSLPKELEEPFVKKRAHAYIYTLLVNCNITISPSFVSRLLEDNGLPSLTDPRFKHLSYHLEASDKSNTLHIDLIAGTIKWNDRPFQHKISTKNIASLFPQFLSLETSYNFLGNCAYFTHALFGSMRLINTNNPEKCRLEKKQDNEWYQYVEIHPLHFALFFRGVSCWMSTSFEKKKLLAIDNTTGKTTLHLDEKSISVMFDEHKRIPLPVKETFFQHQNFLLDKNILLTSLKLSNGDLLSFKYTDEQYRYTYNPQYTLVENDTHFLSSQKFITLKHRHSDTKKIFVFLEEISNSLSNGNGYLDFQLVEYDLKKGKIDCFTQEGILYLSYLYLLQGETSKANQLLSSAFLKKTFSPTSLTICSWIFETNVQHSETYAIKLTLWALYIKQPQKSSQHFWLRERMQETYYRYKQYEALIGNHFLLSDEKSLFFNTSRNQNAPKTNQEYLLDWEGIARREIECDLDSKENLFENSTFEHSFPDAYKMARQGKNKQRLRLRLALRPFHPLAAILNYAIIHGNNSPSDLPTYGKVTRIINKDILAPDLPRSKEINQGLLFPFVSLPEEKNKSVSSLEPTQATLFFENNILQLDLPKVLKKEEPFIAFEQHFIKEERVFVLDQLLDQLSTQVSTDIDVLGYKKGRELLLGKEMFNLKDAPLLQFTLSEKIKQLTQELDDYEKCILEIANLLPKDIKKRLKKERGKDGELDMKKIAQLFFRGTREAFINANTELWPSVELHQANISCPVQHLFNQIGAYMVLRIRLRKLKRAYNLLLTINRSNNSLTNKSRTQKLASELKYASSHFDPEKYPQFLAFENLSGFSLRPNQASLLQKLLKTDKERYCDQIIQMMMGEGKTAVIAPLLLIMAAKPGRLLVKPAHYPFVRPDRVLVQPGRLAVFVAPASQYTTVLHNLRGSIKDLDKNRNIEELEEISRDSLDEQKCRAIFDQLKKMIEQGDILIVTPEKMGKLLLCYLALPAHEMDTHKANYLRTIIEIFYKQADAVFDEVHISLNVDYKVNFPFELSEKVDANKISLTKRLFSLFMQEDISINEKGEKINFKKVLCLHQRRDALSEQECAWISGAVAFNIMTLLPQLGWQDGQYFQPLFRYLHGTMSEKSQKQLDGLNEVLSPEEKADYNFLQYLRDLYNSNSEEDYSIAESFAHLRLILQKVLPPCYKKVCNQHFARRKIFADSNGLYQHGAIAPLDGVGAQKESCFGFHWEDIIFHFRVALETGIDAQQLISVAENLNRDATTAMKREKIHFDKTLEAIKFYEITSVNLYSFVTNPEKYLPIITNNLKNNLEARLKIEEETIHHVVRYYPQFITSTGHSLVNMFSTVRGMTATPWNDISFADRLKKEKHYEEGIEEQIIAQYIDRIADPNNKTAMHFVPSLDPQTLLESCLQNHPEKERVQGLIDVAGYFKDFSNEELAIIFRNYFQKPALFLTYDLSKNEKTPDSLAVMKLGSNTPFIIGGTRLVDIQRAGLEVEDYVVVIDQRHATGLDLPFMAGAIMLITVDMSLKIGDFCQASLRLREFFLNQRPEIVLLEAYRSHFKESCRLSIFCQLMKNYKGNQKEIKKQHFNKSLYHNIDDTFMQHGINRLFEGNKSKDWENAIVFWQRDDAYFSHGTIEYMSSTEDVLKNYGNNKLKALSKACQLEIKERIHQVVKIENRISQIVKEATTDENFDPLTKKAPINLGSHMEVQSELQNQVQANVLIEIDQNLLIELENKKLSFNKRDEFVWNEKNIQLFFEALVSNSSHEEYFSFSKLFLPTRNFSYPHFFGEIFQSQLFCTQSWAYPCIELLPFYHKMQRPIDLLLVVKNKEKSIAIAIAQYEHHYFRDFLEKHPRRFPTLSLISSSEDLETAPQDMHQILIESNVFNGSVSFLNKYAQTTAKWLYAKKQPERNAVIQFLKLKTYDDNFEKKNLASSNIFMTDIENLKRKMHLDKGAQFAIYSQEQIEAFTERDKQKIANLNSAEVNFLKPELANELLPGQIPFLTNQKLIEALTIPFLIDRLQPNQMPWITDTQIPRFEGSIRCTQSIPGERIAKFTDKQIYNLCEQQIIKIKDKAQIERIEKIRPEHLQFIVKEQVHLVSEPFVHYLKKEEAIRAYLESLSDEKLLKLDEHQLNFLSSEFIQKRFRAKELLAKLPNTRVNDIDPTVVNDLPKEKRPFLTNMEHIATLSNEKLLELNERQLNILSARFIKEKFRTQELLAKLPNTRVNDIDPTVVNDLPKEKRPFLTKKAHLEALSDEKLLELDDRQLNILSSKFIQSRFRSQALLAKLPIERIGDVDPTVVNNLSPEQIGRLTKDEQITALDTSHIPFIHQDICKRYRAERKKIITALVVSIIALIVPCALLCIGSIGLHGGLSVFAPQFSVKIFSYLGSSLVVASLLVGGGGTFIISLMAFVIYTCCKLSKHPTSKIKADLIADKVENLHVGRSKALGIERVTSTQY